jgi:hypothetical protein
MAGGKEQHAENAQGFDSKTDRKMSKKELRAVQKSEKRNQRRQRKLQKQRRELDTEPDAGEDGDEHGAIALRCLSCHVMSVCLSLTSSCGHELLSASMSFRIEQKLYECE